jgi:hypothetical protein
MRADYVVDGYSLVHLTGLSGAKFADNEVGTRSIRYDRAAGVTDVSFFGCVCLDILVALKSGWGGRRGI